VRSASGEASKPPALGLGLKPQTLAIVRAGLHGVVNAPGTGARARLAEVAVAGKTGTAQLVSHARQTRGGAPTQALRSHGWFVAFAPVENPRIALAVLVEHGGGGGESAAPIARKVLAHFFNVATAPPAQVAGAVADPER
jgi:penicillin-binding protein 2